MAGRVAAGLDAPAPATCVKPVCGHLKGVVFWKGYVLLMAVDLF
jgi:hypothetical protein